MRSEDLKSTSDAAPPGLTPTPLGSFSFDEIGRDSSYIPDCCKC